MRRKSKASSAIKAASPGTTRPRRTMFGLGCLCVLGLVVFLGSGASSVGAAESFPGQGFLPNNRAWEMVSPPDKNGGDAHPNSARTRAATDGNAIQFVSPSGFGDSRSTGVRGEYIAERTAAPGTNGWATHSILPKQPPPSVLQSALGHSPRYVAEMSADLSRGIYLYPTQLPGYEVPNAANNVNLYLRDDLRDAGPGSYRLLTEPFAPTPATLFPKRSFVAGASASFSKVIFESEGEALTEDAAQNSQGKLYESAEGELRLAGRIPASGTECDDESGPACVAAENSQAGQSSGGSGNFLHYTPHMVSADGRRVFFRANETGNVYMREDGHRTVQLNVSEKAVPESAQGAQLYDASASGDRIFFETGEGLVNGDDDGISDIYMAEPDAPVGQRLTLVSVDDEPAVTDGVLGVIGASDDGQYLYFMMSGQLVAGEDSLVSGVYAWHEGAISYIGSFAQPDFLFNSLGSTTWLASANMSNARVTPDGRHLLFLTRDSSGFQGHGGFGGYDQEEKQEYFLYSAGTDQLRCATCNFGTVPTANAEINTDAQEIGGGAEPTSHLSHALSDDGRFVFFNTPEALVPEDINGRVDAYEYDSSTEEVHLLSSGKSGSNSYFVEAGASGRDVFIATREALSGWDTDTSYDLYDARIGGGLPEPVPPPPSCQGDACQPAPARLNDPTPASSGYSGPHSSRAGRKARCAKGRHTVKSKGKSHCVKSKHKRAAKRKRRTGK